MDATLSQLLTNLFQVTQENALLRDRVRLLEQTVATCTNCNADKLATKNNDKADKADQANEATDDATPPKRRMAVRPQNQDAHVQRAAD